jgi:release factor glutamine methyltransferase
LQVDFAKEAVESNPGLADGSWADLGTGSGAIAIALARSVPVSTVYAVDKSPTAVAVARQNVKRYRLQEVVLVRAGSWFEPLADFAGGLAGIVSNPPYIPSENLGGLQREVGAHEPMLALDGGSGEGLEAFGPLCDGAAGALRPGGFVGLETNGWGQAERVAEMLERSGHFCGVEVRADYSEVQRFVLARRR